MDPLSITASSLTLADAAAKIYRFLQSIHRADADYAGLCAELHSLTDFSRSIARTLQDCQRHPLALAPIDEDVWKQSRNAMADSQQTIDELSALVKRIGGPERSDSIIGRARVATEIHVHARDIVAFRDKIRMSNLSLQTLLQVINVSLSLRSNTSQTMILRELEQLNQYLEISIRATAGNNPLFKIDKSDIRVVQSLKNLVRAASDFHSSASSDASTIFSGSHLSMDTMEGCRYAESVLQPAGTVSDRRHLETLLWQNRLPSRMDSLKASRTRGLQSISETQQHPEGEGDEEGLGQHSNLDSLVSGGLNKLAQKALWRFDFSQAEKILQQALGRHKPSASDDTHQSRLRTQLAICSFLQGRGTQIEDAVIDIVEYRGTKRPVGHQLLYNLALSYTHHLNFEAARKIFSRLWESLRDPDFSNSLKRNDILRLLVFSYRMSGDRLLAEAIEEEHPKLARLTDDGLPSIWESVISCEELLVEFLGVNNSSEIPRLFIHRLRKQVELAEKSPFELRLTKQQMQRAADSSDPVSENNDSAESVEQNSPRQFVVPGASIRRRSPSTGGLTRIKSLLKHRDSMTEMVKEYDESENGPPLWQRISPWHRRLGILARQEEPIATEENGNRTSYWMRAQDHLARTDTIRTPKTFSSFRSPSPLRRAFSFMRNPSIPRERRYQPAYMPQGVPELPENCLLEMMDTSPRVELQDTEVVPPHTINRPCRLARPRLVAPSSSVHYSYNEHEIAELPASEIQTPPLEDDNYPQRAKNDGPKPATKTDGYCRPGYAPRYDAGMSLGSSLLSQDDNKKVQTGRGDIPPLTLNPDPKSILGKGPCLDSPSKCPYPGCYLPFTRAQVDATTRPLSSCVQVPRPEPAMWASDQLSTFKKNDIRIVEVSNQDSGCKPGLSQGTDFEIKGLSHRDAMAMRNRGRLFTRTMQNLRRQGRDQKPEKPDRISANCARLQCSFNGEDEETDIPVGSKVHQIRMPFKIPSPTAVLRRYTNEQAKTPESLKSVSIDIDIGRHRERYSPWIIAGPVELDSRPIEATLYPRI